MEVTASLLKQQERRYTNQKINNFFETHGGNKATGQASITESGESGKSRESQPKLRFLEQKPDMAGTLRGDIDELLEPENKLV